MPDESHEGLDRYREGVLQIFSRDGLRLIRNGDPTWEEMVPDAVAASILDRGLFGHPRSAA
jgi:hypothetical protein